jgi:hypothetical protein
VELSTTVKERTMTTGHRTGTRDGSRGFALVIAILSLLLLTFLGLTLAVSTTTELQIATNYKWSMQALANAEAGIEVGKRVLRNMTWSAILPPPRSGPPGWPKGGPFPARPTAPFSGATRNFENADCDSMGDLGYGYVLNDGTSVYENVSTIPNTTIFPATVNGVSTQIQGAFTLWIRRPLVFNPDETYNDYSTDNETLILTSEGTAPYTPTTTASAGSTVIATNRAVRVMEVRMSQVPLQPCGSRSGQQGLGQAGAGFAACATLGDDALTGEMQAAGATGTGAQLGGGSGN